jgi:hypothetical protein
VSGEGLERKRRMERKKRKYQWIFSTFFVIDSGFLSRRRHPGYELCLLVEILRTYTLRLTFWQYQERRPVFRFGQTLAPNV